MTPEQFREETEQFRRWFLQRLTGFEHSWTSIGHLHQVGVPKGENWQCRSLFDAYQAYTWPSQVRDPAGNRSRVFDFDATQTYLMMLQQQMVEALRLRNGAMGQCACKAVLEWGGVLHRKHVACDVKNAAMQERVCAHLVESRDQIDAMIRDGYEADVEIERTWYSPLRIDSGTTKIFSLLCEAGFIIYDARVAAALGLLVRCWAEVQFSGQADPYRDVPSSLRFCVPAYGAQARRDPDPPNRHRRLFPQLQNDQTRLQDNVRASWLLRDVLNDDQARRQPSGFAQLHPDLRLRALEAALFMIGYDVSTVPAAA